MAAKTKANTNPDPQTRTGNQANARNQANAEATRGTRPSDLLSLPGETCVLNSDNPCPPIP